MKSNSLAPQCFYIYTLHQVVMSFIGAMLVFA